MQERPPMLRVRVLSITETESDTQHAIAMIREVSHLQTALRPLAIGESGPQGSPVGVVPLRGSPFAKELMYRHSMYTKATLLLLEKGHASLDPAGTPPPDCHGNLVPQESWWVNSEVNLLPSVGNHPGCPQDLPSESLSRSDEGSPGPPDNGPR